MEQLPLMATYKSQNEMVQLDKNLIFINVHITQARHFNNWCISEF